MNSAIPRFFALLATASLVSIAACSSSSGGTSSTTGGVSGTTTGLPGTSSGGNSTGATVNGSGTTTGNTAGSASATTTGGTTTGPIPFKLTFSPSEATTPANASLPITVLIDRDPGQTGVPFADPLQFSLADNPDAGITALFSPNPANENQTTMTLSIAAGVSAADHLISVVASDTVNTTLQTTTGFDVNVSAAATILLVDNDASANNADPTNPTVQQSPSDALFTTLLGPISQGGVNLPYAYFIVPSDGSGSTTPTFSQAQNYDTIIWYTGANSGGAQPTMSAAQEAVLTGWLDTGNKTLILFSENLVYDLAGSDWTDPPTDNLLANYLGAVGTDDDGDLSDVTYTANGTSLFNNEIFNVVKDTPIASTADRINPGTGVDSLITVPYDETGSGTAQPVPAAVGRYHVGAAGTSTIVYVGIPIEDITVNGQSESSNLSLFELVLSYALPNP